MQKTLERQDLIYPELSYQVVGALFSVYTELGAGYKEKTYQKAIEQAFKIQNLNYVRELPVRITYKNKPVGILFFDFLVDNKIVLEVKVRNYFSVKDINQLYSYLRSKNLKLGIIAHFTKSGVKFKRILNLS